MKAISFMFVIILITFLGLLILPLKKLHSQISNRDNVHPAFSIQNSQALMNTPQFTTTTRLKTGNSYMKVDTYTSVPCVVDWNADGKKDLLVGCFYYGNVYFYLNSGTNEAPVFTTGSKLMVSGNDISVAYG